MQNRLSASLDTPTGLIAHSVTIRAINLLALVFGCWVLLSRIFHLSINTTFPAASNMVANSALGFILAGLGTLLLRDALFSKWPKARLVSRLCAYGLFALGASTLLERLFDLNLKIDEFIVQDDSHSLAISPGRMSAMTALNFTLLGALLVFHQWRPGFWQLLCEVLAVSILGISGLALLGYLFSSQALYHLSPYTSMALLTALLFVLLALGELLAIHRNTRMALGYGLTLIAVALALKLYLTVGEWLGGNIATFVLFYPVIMLASSLAGLGPSLFALIMFIFVVAIWIYEPVGFLLVAAPINLVSLMLFLVNGLFINAVFTLYRRHRQKVIGYEREQSERTFAELIERSPFGTYVVDSQFRIAIMNRGSQEGAFRNVHPVIGRDFAEAVRILWPEDVAVEIIDHFRHTLDSGKPYYSPRFINPRHDVANVESYEWELHRMNLPDGQFGVICYYYDSTALRVAESALHESEKRMQQALDVSHSFAFEWEPATDNVTRSHSCAAILGLNGEEISHDTGQRFFQRIHPEDRKRFTAILEQLNPFKEQYQIQYRLLRPDGGVVVLEESGLGKFDAYGKLSCLIGFATDVTVREQAVLALRENEERQRQLMALLPVGIYTIKATTGEISYYNEQAVNLWGRRPDLGDTDERFCGSYRLWQPDGSLLPHDKTPMTQVLTEGRALRNLQVVIERPDASRIRVLVNIDPILDHDGCIVGAVNVFQDITALHETEKALGEQKSLLQSITDNASTALFIMDDCQQCIFMNPAAEKLSGYCFEETIGRTLHEVVHHTRPDGSHYPLSECPIDQAFPKNDREQGEEIFIHKDGHFYPVAFTASPLRNEQNQPVGTIIEVQNITVRKQAEEVLREDDRRKNQFLATLAHELRNPLAPISNGLHILEMPGIENAAIEKVRAMMTRQVNHMVRLVDDLMEVSRITRGLLELKKEKIDLSEVLRNAVETTRPIIDKEKHQFDINLPPEPIILEADKVRLAQIFNNLLNNAAKYTPPGGRIWLSAFREGDFAVVSVRDNGLGIPAEMQTKVFDMFIQVNHSNQRAQGGLGIGLTLVKNLVNLHGGHIDVTSEGLNQGCEFVVRLPLPKKMIPTEQSGQTENQPVQKFAHRILVVDDNQDAADSIALLLRHMTPEVRTTYDGLAAIETVNSFQPSVVLLDIGMPGMDGYEVARRIRQTPNGQAIKLIALTGWGQEEDRQKSAEAGFDHHLVKPVNLNALIELLKSSAEKKLPVKTL